MVHPNFATKNASYAYAQCCNVVGDASAPMGLAKMRLDGSAVVQTSLNVGDKNEGVDVYWVGPRRFAGEPLVVPKRNGNMAREEDAYLVGLVYDAVKDRSSLMVFDLERDLKEGFAPDGSVQKSCFC